MINLNDIVNWRPLKDGEQIKFHSDRPRPVTLDFNTSGPAKLFILLMNKEHPVLEPQFLATVNGRETVKFVTPGAYGIAYSAEPDVQVFILTSDGAEVHRENIEDEVYTTLYDPGLRDPDHERLIQQINAKVQRRLDMMEAQYERLLYEAEKREYDANSRVEPDQHPDGSNVADPVGAGDEPKPQAGSDGEPSGVQKEASGNQ